MRFAIRAQPGAARAVVGGRWGESDLGADPALVVRVTARAVDGAANDAIIDAIADAFGARSRSVRIVRGHRSRHKLIEIDGDEAVLATRFNELLGP